MRINSKLSITSLALSLLSTGVLAQESATDTATAAAATFTVEVGKGNHEFRPDVIQANVGDVVRFNFFPPNHTVVRAAYLYPCVPYEMIVPGEPGFFSGFHPVDAILDNPPNWSIVINDTEPIFFYCSAPGSCIDWQMVGVINPNSTQLLSTQKAFAANSSYMLNPGEDFPAESSPTSTVDTSYPSATGSSSSDTSPGSTGTAAAAATTTAATDSHHKSSFPAGAIAGIVVGVVAIIALAAALFYFVGRHRSMKAKEAAAVVPDNEKAGMHGPASPPPGEPIYGPGGMVYVPAQTPDYNRMSVPPMYGSPDMSQHRFSEVPAQEMSQVDARAVSPPVEMWAPAPAPK